MGTYDKHDCINVNNKKNAKILSDLLKRCSSDLHKNSPLSLLQILAEQCPGVMTLCEHRSRHHRFCAKKTISASSAATVLQSRAPFIIAANGDRSGSAAAPCEVRSDAQSIIYYM